MPERPFVLAPALHHGIAATMGGPYREMLEIATLRGERLDLSCPDDSSPGARPPGSWQMGAARSTAQPTGPGSSLGGPSGLSNKIPSPQPLSLFFRERDFEQTTLLRKNLHLCNESAYVLGR